jgi:hypothetical protein
MSAPCATGWVGGGVLRVRQHRPKERSEMSKAAGDRGQEQGTFEQRRAELARARAARLDALWQMSATERVRAMRRGELTLEQCAAWAARYPEQVPLIDGEFEYIAAFTPEVAE